jgi:hypothetical protein
MDPCSKACCSSPAKHDAGEGFRPEKLDPRGTCPAQQSGTTAMAAPPEQLLRRVPTCHAAEALPPLPLLTPPRVVRCHFPAEVAAAAPGLPTASRRRSDHGGAGSAPPLRRRRHGRRAAPRLSAAPGKVLKIEEAPPPPSRGPARVPDRPLRRRQGGGGGRGVAGESPGAGAARVLRRYG